MLICTREGEVWKFDTDSGKWDLYADGLHESLGLWVDHKKNDVYVMQRPELTRLVDTNKDGKAYLYETVNAGWGLTDNYHEYSFGPVRDSKGNFYGTLNTSLLVGRVGPVATDGTRHECMIPKWVALPNTVDCLFKLRHRLSLCRIHWACVRQRGYV